MNWLGWTLLIWPYVSVLMLVAVEVLCQGDRGLLVLLLTLLAYVSLASYLILRGG